MKKEKEYIIHYFSPTSKKVYYLADDGGFYGATNNALKFETKKAAIQFAKGFQTNNGITTNNSEIYGLFVKGPNGGLYKVK